MQILGHSKNTASESFNQFLKKSEKIKSRIKWRDWNCCQIDIHNGNSKMSEGESMYLLVGQAGLEPATGRL